MRSASSRSLRHRAAVAGGAGMLLVMAVACGPADEPDSGSKVADAVEKLTSRKSATVVARVDGTPSEVRDFLREAGGRDGGGGRAERLADGELTMVLGADRPLNELDTYGPRTGLAWSVNLGDKDVITYKSVQGKVYIRLKLWELAREGHLGKKRTHQVRELGMLGHRLPSSLGSAEALLKGRWVRLQPNSYQDFGWALERLSGMPISGERAEDAGSVLDGSELRKMLGGLRKILVERAGSGGGASGGTDTGGRNEKVRVTLPAREVARELTPALRRLGVDMRPSDVPKKRVTAELTLRGGTLAGLRMDLAALTAEGGAGSARLPLQLDFASGDALSVEPPRKTRKLEPQDLLAAFLYGRTHQAPAASGKPPAPPAPDRRKASGKPTAPGKPTATAEPSAGME